MSPDILLLATYRLLALAVAIAMIWTMLRAREWRTQLYAMLVFIPFVLRAAGVK
jgi:ABC-type molybdate transport system permease subunit